MWRRASFLAGLLLLATIPCVEGVITRLTPLSEVLAANPFIFTVKVQAVDADKLTAVFVVSEDLKGKFPVRRLLVNLTGDAEAKKDKHTEVMLKRLAPAIELMVFVDSRGNNYNVFGYTDGTWFQMLASKAKDADKTVFAFLHCEPYLRRTYKGTTAEMKQVVVDSLAKKVKPPEPDPKEPPGFGPEVKVPEPEAFSLVSLQEKGQRKVAKLQAEKQSLRLLTENGNGMVLSSPVVDGKRLYISAAHGVLARFGVVYCIDLETQKTIWTFDDQQAMKQGFSSPVLANGRLFFGEGLHEDQNCKLYCVNAKSGKKIWDFATTSHTEGTPAVANGRVYFGAGDDGVYCLDAATGKKLWQFTGQKKLHLHVDSTPAIAGNRIYCGSGVDEDSGQGDPSIFCLDADTGNVVWLHRTPKWTSRLDDKMKTPQHVPAWASPITSGGIIYFGVGNGRVGAPSNVFQPAGGLMAISAVTGMEMWPAFRVPDGVLNRPAVDREGIYFGCRDGNVYCVNTKNGQLRWKIDLGSPVIASPVLVSDHSVFLIGSEGRIACADPQTGKADWIFRELEKAMPLLVSTPAIVASGDERRLYFGACFHGLATPAVYSLQDSK